ncbi:MAG: exo-alpha-sialidase [Thermoplasmata archaeon]|nr:MAG: exo-alpha-sialidase [Thermoplasmata archaeon]
MAVDKSNGNIYVVWQDYRNSPDPYSIDIYFANSTDGGITFGDNKRILDETGNIWQNVPSIAANNGLIGVVWEDQRGGIYFANSTDDGNTFGENKRVNDMVGSGVFYPKIAIDNNKVIYIVWEDNPDGKFYIYFSKSTDGGNTFTQQKKVSDNPLIDGQRMPSLGVDYDNNIYVVWVDYQGTDTNISYAKSTNGGDNFTIRKQVNDDPGIAKQYQPSIAVNEEEKIFITWLDEREGGYNIYFANSTDGGNTFSSNQKINNGPNISAVYTPSNAIAVNGSHAFIVWQDDRKGDWDIYFTRSNWEPPMTTPISPPINSTLTNNTPLLRVTSITDLDNDTVYYNFTISDQPDAETGTVYYSGWITSTSWKTPPLPDGKWYWHTYTYDGFNMTSPNWIWNFTIDTTQNYVMWLYESWNLISIPFIQMDTDLESVLNSINGSYDAVQMYDANDYSDPWKHYQISKPSHLNNLENIDHKMGFWIHVTQPGGILLQCLGIIPMENQSISLKPGWNLVGYPSLSNKSRTIALNNLTFNTEIDAIWTYNASSQKWEQIGEFDYFERGRGYYVHSKAEVVWEIPL